VGGMITLTLVLKWLKVTINFLNELAKPTIFITICMQKGVIRAYRAEYNRIKL